MNAAPIRVLTVITRLELGGAQRVVLHTVSRLDREIFRAGLAWGPGDVLDDEAFALELLEKHHVLVAPGSSFNTSYTDHFRVTTLPDTESLHTVFDRIEACLANHA